MELSKKQSFYKETDHISAAFRNFIFTQSKLLRIIQYELKYSLQL